MKDTKTPLLDRMRGGSVLGTTRSGVTGTVVPTATLQQALKTILAKVTGIGDVRVLWKHDRKDVARHKVFVVLATHDVTRDAKIVDVMCQLDDVDFDLVPAESAALVPARAERFALN